MLENSGERGFSNKNKGKLSGCEARDGFDGYVLLGKMLRGPAVAGHGKAEILNHHKGERELRERLGGRAKESALERGAK